MTLAEFLGRLYERGELARFLALLPVRTLEAWYQSLTVPLAEGPASQRPGAGDRLADGTGHLAAHVPDQPARGGGHPGNQPVPATPGRHNRHRRPDQPPEWTWPGRDRRPGTRSPRPPGPGRRDISRSQHPRRGASRPQPDGEPRSTAGAAPQRPPPAGRSPGAAAARYAARPLSHRPVAAGHSHRGAGARHCGRRLRRQCGRHQPGAMTSGAAGPAHVARAAGDRGRGCRLRAAVPAAGPARPGRLPLRPRAGPAAGRPAGADGGVRYRARLHGAGAAGARLAPSARGPGRGGRLRRARRPGTRPGSDRVRPGRQPRAARARRGGHPGAGRRAHRGRTAGPGCESE